MLQQFWYFASCVTPAPVNFKTTKNKTSGNKNQETRSVRVIRGMVKEKETEDAMAAFDGGKSTLPRLKDLI